MTGHDSVPTILLAVAASGALVSLASGRAPRLASAASVVLLAAVLLLGWPTSADPALEKLVRVLAGILAVAGGGLVTVTMTGKSEMKRIHIDPSLLKADEAEILEDLIVAGVNEARARAETALAERMRALTSGMQLPPGMKLPF